MGKTLNTMKSGKSVAPLTGMPMDFLRFHTASAKSSQPSQDSVVKYFLLPPLNVFDLGTLSRTEVPLHGCQGSAEYFE